jgi:hypothetical protein
MSLVSQDELAAFLRQPTGNLAGVLEAAEAVVAAAVGAPSLGERLVSEEQNVARSCGGLELSAGPLTSLVALSIDGEDCPEAAAGPWWLRVPGDFTRGSRVRVEYQAGWTTANLPDAVRQAVLLTAATLHARPDLTVRAERLGDLSRQHEPPRTPLPAAATLLLAPYRRP